MIGVPADVSSRAMTPPTTSLQLEHQQCVPHCRRGRCVSPPESCCNAFTPLHLMRWADSNVGRPHHPPTYPRCMARCSSSARGGARSTERSAALATLRSHLKYNRNHGRRNGEDSAPYVRFGGLHHRHRARVRRPCCLPFRYVRRGRCSDVHGWHHLHSLRVLLGYRISRPLFWPQRERRNLPTVLLH